jgi:hypothetical protein
VSIVGGRASTEATLTPGRSHLLSPDADKQGLVEQAAADAEAALARDPDQVDALLQLAIALGQLAGLEDPVTAHVNGYARQGKALIDRALALDLGNE